MKLLLLALCLMTSSLFAASGEVLIDSRLESTTPSGSVVGTFKADESSSKAWIELSFGNPVSKVEKIDLYGLFYEANFIVYRRGLYGAFDYDCAGIIGPADKREIRVQDCGFKTRKEMMTVGGKTYSYLNTYMTYF